MAERHEFTVDLASLISLLARNLYTEQDVFIRELVQNAHDSLLRAKSESSREVPNRIDIETDSETRTIRFRDGGKGLTESEIDDVISKIGRSKTAEVRKAIGGSDRSLAESLIGQFGIGLLSAFIVADQIVLDTKALNADAVRWISDGGPVYEIEPSDRSEIGTTVSLHLKPLYLSFLSDDVIRSAVKRYADFIGIPIYINGSEAPVNSVDAPWHKWGSGIEPDATECWMFWEKRFLSEKSLHTFSINEEFQYIDEDGQRQIGHVRGILGITDRHTPDVNSRGTVDLFIRRVFIAGSARNVLPGWAKFIQGVVECNELEPNAARDNVMQGGRLVAVQRALHEAIMQELRELSAADPVRFKEIMRWHAFHVLGMAVQPQHTDFFKEVADLIPLASDAGPLTIAEYLRDAPRRTDGAAVVHYLHERQSASQYFMLCQARGLRVFDCSETFAERFLLKYAETWPEKVKLSRVDTTTDSAILDEPDDITRSVCAYVEDALRRLVPDPALQVRITRFKPSEVPAIITSGRGLETADDAARIIADPTVPSYLRQAMEGLLERVSDHGILNVNADSPIIQRLAAQGPSVSITNQSALTAIVNNAVLLAARKLSGVDIERMFSQYGRLIEDVVSLRDEKAQLEGMLVARESELIDQRSGGGSGALTRYVQCFVAMSYSEEWASIVYAELKSILEAKPFYWRVLRADDQARDAALWPNIKTHMLSSHCFIALIGDENTNVAIEVGRMEAIDRPILLIKREGSRLPSDLSGRLYIDADASAHNLRARLADAISKQEFFRDQLGERYLSSAVLDEIGVGGAATRQLMEKCKTWQDLVNSDAVVLAQTTGLSEQIVRAVQSDIAAKLA